MFESLKGEQVSMLSGIGKIERRKGMGKSFNHVMINVAGFLTCTGIDDPL